MVQFSRIVDSYDIMAFSINSLFWFKWKEIDVPGWVTKKVCTTTLWFAVPVTPSTLKNVKEKNGPNVSNRTWFSSRCFNFSDIRGRPIQPQEYNEENENSGPTYGTLNLPYLVSFRTWNSRSVVFRSGRMSHTQEWTDMLLPSYSA